MFSWRPGAGPATGRRNRRWTRPAAARRRRCAVARPRRRRRPGQQPLDQRQRSHHRMEIGRRAGIEQQRLRGVGLDRRQRAVGQRQHRHAGLAAIPRRFQRLASVGILGDADQQVLRPGGVELVGIGAAQSMHQHAIAGDHAVRVGEVIADGEAGPRAQEIEAPRRACAARPAQCPWAHWPPWASAHCPGACAAARHRTGWRLRLAGGARVPGRRAMAQRVLEHLPERTVAFIAQRLRQARHAVGDTPACAACWRIDSRPASRGLRATQAAARCNSAPSAGTWASIKAISSWICILISTHLYLNGTNVPACAPSGAGAPGRGTRPRAAPSPAASGQGCGTPGPCRRSGLPHAPGRWRRGSALRTRRRRRARPPARPSAWSRPDGRPAIRCRPGSPPTNRRSALMKRKALARPPSSTKAKVEPAPLHWRLYTSW